MFILASSYVLLENISVVRSLGICRPIIPEVLWSYRDREWRNNKQVLQIHKPVEMSMKNSDVKWLYISDKETKIKHREEMDFNCDTEPLINMESFSQCRQKPLYLLFITFCISGTDIIRYSDK